MRRTLPHRTVLPGTVLLALVVATLASSGSAAAQTLTVHTPDTLHVGQSVIVRPEPRDVIDRPTSVSRVLAVPLVPGPLDVSYASGGQRFTARAPGTVPVLWLWDRVDGQRLLQLDTVLVLAAPDTAPPPVVVPPDTTSPVVTPPAPAVVTLLKLNITPYGTQLLRGETQTLSTWATATAGGQLRTATTAELRAADLRWTTADTTVARIGQAPGTAEQSTVRGVAPGRTTARVCASAGAVAGLCSPAVPITVRPAPSDTATPPVDSAVVTPPDTTTPVVPVDTITPPVVPPDSTPSGAVTLSLARDTVAVGDTVALSLAGVPDSVPVHWALRDVGTPRLLTASSVQWVAVASYVGSDLPPIGAEPHRVRVAAHRPGTIDLWVMLGADRATAEWRRVTLTVLPVVPAPTEVIP
ncbi:MAG TPA: hypothetical protein VFS08_04705 [Gemmatimonadaceae bacterium]|nr:hypothetical protein [Gemmatimonadaceae bacterium]